MDQFFQCTVLLIVVTHTCKRLIGKQDKLKKALCPCGVCTLQEAWWLASGHFKLGLSSRHSCMTCMHALSESLYNPGTVPGSADQCIYGNVGSWFVASEIQNTQKAQQLGRTCCEMHDNASHASRIRIPCFVDRCPLTQIHSLLASGKLSSDLWLRNYPES